MTNIFVGILCRITTHECVKFVVLCSLFCEKEIVVDEKEEEEEANNRSHTSNKIAAIIPNAATYMSLCVYNIHCICMCVYKYIDTLNTYLNFIQTQKTSTLIGGNSKVQAKRGSK